MKNIILSIAEDDPAHIFVIQGTLKNLFKEVNFCLAKNGKELLEILPGARPDRLLLDINMPIINGLEVVVAVRKVREYDYLPIVMFSSSDKESVRIDAFSKGADGYFVKPPEDRYGEVINEIITTPYPKRSQFIKPSILPSLIEEMEAVEKNSNWADIDAMLGDL